MEGQLNPKRRCEQNVDFPGLNLLQVARCDFGAFRQLVLRQFPADPLPAHIRAEDLDPLPFFFGNCHDILHRFLMPQMNDTYIVKIFGIPLATAGACLRPSSPTRIFERGFSGWAGTLNDPNQKRKQDENS
jgi:hypothetical protein